MKENNIYVVEHHAEGMFNTRSHFVIVIAASSIEVAKKFVKEKIGIDAQPTLLSNAKYPTIYVSNGSVPEPIQPKILYNGNCHYNL
jgi:hypothetical protein